MSSKQEHPKLREIYAFYGYSMLLAQQLEGLLTQAIYAFIVIPENSSLISEMAKDNDIEKWAELVDSEDAKLFRDSMGILIRNLRKKNVLSKDIEKRLKETLKERNFLAHQFFKDYLSKFYTEKGQDECIYYLRKTGGLIQQTLDEFTPIVRAEMEKYGYDKDLIETYANNELKAAKQNN